MSCLNFITKEIIYGTYIQVHRVYRSSCCQFVRERAFSVLPNEGIQINRYKHKDKRNAQRTTLSERYQYINMAKSMTIVKVAAYMERKRDS